MFRRFSFLLMTAWFLCALSIADANPFNVDSVTIPAKSESTPVATAADSAPDEGDTATPGADEPSLIKDLSRIYRTLGPWKGKRNEARPENAKEHHLKNYDNLDINIDGDNYCGQFAMSTLLKGMGIEADPQKVYQESNPKGIFTAPPTIAEYLRANGIDARMKNRAGIKDITKRIDEGKPVIVLVESSGGVPHWVCITGYDTDASGNVVSLRMRDSYWGDEGPHTMPIDKFMTSWNKPFGNSVLGSLVSYSNVLIDNNGTCSPTSTPYPGTFETATEDNMASGINDVVNGWTNRSVTQTIGGATKLVLGLPGAIVGVASNFAKNSGRNMSNWGQERWKQGGLWNRVSGGAAIVGGNIASSAGSAGKAVADLWSSGASLIGQGAKRLRSLFS
ncbi:MAG TPA: hypothetical protein PLM07_08120 [Candidatus Rifleibacterium sp.]|nr:hypothetical protein [Candidatus Rifleibacterium sp.]HPT45850.1 hypothetical protein [Candidatus Rifleibacterium sp.]